MAASNPQTANPTKINIKPSHLGFYVEVKNTHRHCSCYFPVAVWGGVERAYDAARNWAEIMLLKNTTI